MCKRHAHGYFQVKPPSGSSPRCCSNLAAYVCSCLFHNASEMKDIEDYGLIEQVDLLPQHSLAPADLPAERRVGVTRTVADFSAAGRGTDRSMVLEAQFLSHIHMSS